MKHLYYNFPEIRVIRCNSLGILCLSSGTGTSEAFTVEDNQIDDWKTEEE